MFTGHRTMMFYRTPKKTRPNIKQWLGENSMFTGIGQWCLQASNNDVYRHQIMMFTGIEQWCWQDIEQWCWQASNNDVYRHQTMMLTGHRTMIDQTLNNDWEITRRLLDIEWWCLLTPKKTRPDTYWWLGNTVAPKSRCWTPQSNTFQLLSKPNPKR